MDEGVRVFDISVPMFPFEIAQIEPTKTTYSLDQYEADDDQFRLAVAFWNDGVRLYDVTTASVPTEVGAVENSSPYFSIDADSGRVAVLNRNGWAEVYDISLENSPKLVSQLSFSPSLPYDIYLDRSLLLILDRDTGVIQYNIADTENPEYIFTYPFRGRVYGMSSDRGRFWVGGDAGVQGLRLHYEQCTTLNQWDDYSSTPSVTGIGDYLYVATEDLVEVWQVTTPGERIMLGHIDIANGDRHAHSMTISGNRLYVGERFGRNISVLDVSSPANPALLGQSLGLTSTTGVIEADGDLVYAAYSTLEIRDLSDPSASVTLSETPLDSHVRQIARDGDLLILILFDNRIAVMDVSDPTAPFEIGSLDDDGDIYSSITVNGQVGYVTSLSGWIRVLDLSDPSQPSIVGEIGGFGQLRQSSLSGDELFVTGNGAGQTLTDVSDDQNPELIIAANEHGALESIYIQDGTLYATSIEGLLAYDLSRCFCQADLNDDGVLTFFDVSIFLIGYAEQDPAFDFNGDGHWNIFDVSIFVQSYSFGCP